MQRIVIFSISILVLAAGGFFALHEGKDFDTFAEKLSGQLQNEQQNAEPTLFIPTKDALKKLIQNQFVRLEKLRNFPVTQLDEHQKATFLKLENQLLAKIEQLKSWSLDPSKYHLLPVFQKLAIEQPEYLADYLSQVPAFFSAGISTLKTPIDLNTEQNIQQQKDFFRFLANELPCITANLPQHEIIVGQNESAQLAVKDFVAFLLSHSNLKK